MNNNNNNSSSNDSSEDTTPPTAGEDCVYTWRREGGGAADLPNSFWQIYEEEGARHPTPPPQQQSTTSTTTSTSSTTPDDEDFIEGDLPVEEDLINANRSQQDDNSVRAAVIPPPPLPTLSRSITLPSYTSFIPSHSQPHLSTSHTFPGTSSDSTFFILPPNRIPNISHLGPSSCGPTALIHILTSVNHQLPMVLPPVLTTVNLRDNNADVVNYLISRGKAGTTAEELIKKIESFTEGRVCGRFYGVKSSKPEDVANWLDKWMRKGAAPLATLNPQKQRDFGPIPDAWHHQMIIGVDANSSSTFLSNPMEKQDIIALLPQLCSESALLVRSKDVLERWDRKTDLKRLVRIDNRWNDMNVLGQVTHVLLHPNSSPSHVAIPCAYKAGITLFARRDSDIYEELFSDEEFWV